MLNDSLLKNVKAINSGVPSPISITDAFYPKSDANLDSWFFIGRGKVNGHDLSFLLHFMTVAGANNMVCLNTVFSVTDKTTGWYSSEDNFLPITDNVRREGDDLIISSDKCNLKANFEKMHLDAKNKDCSIDVEVLPLGYVMNNGGSGYFPILIMKENYHYSMPFFKMKGVIEIEGEIMNFDGDCWLDRQYDYFQMEIKDGTLVVPGGTAPKWAWLGIILDNKTALSIWDYTDPDGHLNSFATVINSEGKQTVLPIDSVVAKADEVWISDKTNQHYPTHWLVDIPELDMHLNISASPKKQEIVAQIPILNKYEGESFVTGTLKGEEITGSCCLELLGIWQ